MVTAAAALSVNITSVNGYGCWTANRTDCFPYTSACLFTRMDGGPNCLFAPKSNDCHKTKNHPKSIPCTGNAERAEDSPDVEEDIEYDTQVPSARTFETTLTFTGPFRPSTLLSQRYLPTSTMVKASSLPSNDVRSLCHRFSPLA